MSITPESLSVNPGFDGNVKFIFGEVVSEGGSPSQGYGTGDLEKLVLLSPTNKVPVVQWQRSRITVRPREGWKPNRVYRVELLPGITDIRNNKGVKGGIVTFTTGAPVPDYTLSGAAFDWAASQPMRGGLIEAVLEPDCLVYRGLTDSSGTYAFGPLPRGTYLVYVGIDQNRNGRIDPREAFDSVRVEPDSGKVPELFAFIHDTTPPRLTPPTAQDSVTLNLTFTQKLDPFTTVRLHRGAGAPVAGLDAAPGPPRHDAGGVRQHLARASDTGQGRLDPEGARRTRPEGEGRIRQEGRRRRADSARAPPRPRGSARRIPGSAALWRGLARQRPAVKLSRPPLSDRLVVRLGAPVTPGMRYLVVTHDVKNVSGVLGSPKAGFETPKRPKPTLADSARALRTRIDSALAKGDTTFADSLKQFLPADSLLKPGAAPQKQPAPTEMSETSGASCRRSTPCCAIRR